jgi:hypothetical protein
MEDCEVKLLEKIDSGEKLSERELKTLVFECNEEERIEGDDRRWQRSIKSIIKFENRYFAISWEQGLTENQEDDFYNQPYEVTKKTYEKTITVTDWIKKEIEAAD